MNANNEIKTIKVPLTNIGWFKINDSTGEKDFEVAKPAFVATMDLRPLGNIAEHLYKTNGLTDKDVQREREGKRVQAISETAIGRIKMDGKLVDEANGEKYEPKNLPFSCIISVTSSAVIEKETKFVDGAVREFLYLVVPVNDEAIEELAKYFFIIDGQHTASAFGDNYRYRKSWGFDAPVFIYLDLDAKEKAEIFDNKNFQAKKAPSDQQYEHAKIRGVLDPDEDMLWDVLDILSSERLETPGIAKPRYSVMREGIKCGQKDKGKATRQQYCRYAVKDRSGKKVREVNLINSYANMIKSMYNKDAVSAYEYACGMNQYALAFNSVHGVTDDEDVNLFVVNQSAGVSKTKVAISFALAQACVEVVENTRGARWDMATLTGILSIMRDTAFDGQTMLEYKNLGKVGGMNAYDFVIDTIKDTVKACNGMTVEEIQERGNECVAL